MRAALVRAHGSDPIACSTLQPGLEYVDTSFGYVAYRRAFGLALSLGPPVCAPEDRQELMDRFVRRVRRPVFMYVRHDDAMLASAVSEQPMVGMGVDKIVPLDSVFDEHRRVQGALKKAARDEFVISEGREERARLHAITQSYLERSAVPVEMEFINRPLSFDDELSRVFVLRQRGETFGYAVLDPWFNAGHVDGYLLNIIRFEPTRIWGVYYSAVANLARTLRSEGVSRLSLGFCPLVDVDTKNCSRTLGAQVRFMEKRFSQVSYLARLREMKDAFPGSTVQRYVVTPSRNGVLNLLALIKVCGVPFGWMIGPQLKKALLSG